MNRVSVHLVASFGERELSSLKRDELQDLLDAKAKGGLSFSVVDPLRWERLIAKLAVIAGVRPGEIFALTWGRLTATFADIRQRVYRGAIDTPKTDQSIRKAALSEGLLREIEGWREFCVTAREDAWVFPSERMTPLSKDNCWRRSMYPRLEKGRLELGKLR